MRVYTVEFENVAVTASQDFFEITAADDKPCKVLGLFLGQSSDVGDAAEEILRYRVIRGHTSSGSGGSAPTPSPLLPGQAAASFTSEVNNTTIASAGTAVNLHSDTFNIRAGEKLWLPEGCEWWVSQASLLVIRLLSTPTDSLSMSGTLYVAELG